jgi:tetratricopeptide (TPR) repeat protein
MIKFCPECGIKLDKDYAFCPNCGNELEKVRKELTKINSSSKPEKIKNIEKAKTQTQSVPAIKNNLGTNKLLGIMGGLVLLVVVILFSSDIFNTPKVSEIVSTPVGNNQSPGVDLSKMNEIKTLEDKVSANPEDSQALLQLANLKHDSGMFEVAIINYKTYLEKNPSDADARVDMGVCYFSLKNYNEAISEMKKAIQYSPKHQLAYINLGIVSVSAGSLDEAKKFWQKAVDLDPGSENGLKAKELLESHK